MSRPEFVADHVLRWLPEQGPTRVRAEEVAVTTLQNDGTGPATIGYTIRGSTHVLADTLTTAFLREYAARAPGRLGNLPLYHRFHVLVSQCRHMKRLRPDDPARPAVLDFYAAEFAAAMGGDLVGSGRLV